MIKCVIVDDEIAGQTILKKKLNKFFPQCNILKIIDNKKEAIDFLTNPKNEVQLLFLDVEIKGGTGVDVLKEIDQSKMKTIFITAYQQYAMEALNNNASYYLLKPIHDTVFKKGVGKIISDIENGKMEEIIFISYKQTQVPIKTTDILYINSEGSYSQIVTENKRYMVSKSIGHYEDLLPKSFFIRTHNSFLVNKNFITEIKRNRSGELTMLNGDKVAVSQRRLGDFMKAYQGEI